VQGGSKEPPLCLATPQATLRNDGLQTGAFDFLCEFATPEEANRLVLQPLTPEFIRSLRGSLQAAPSAMKILQEERKRDRER